MMLIRSLAAAVAGFAALIQPSLAHSTKRNPLNYVSVVEEPVLQSPSHRVNAFSNFGVTFYLHDRKQKVRLALEPNHDVIHDALHITYLNDDGTVRRIEPVDRTEHKVFRGDAFILKSGENEWTNAGWARITLLRDGDNPIFEGTFRLNGDHHHVQTLETYRKLRHEEDPEVDFGGPPSDTMVVWRDSDVIPHWPGSGELKREIYGRSSCSSDELAFNGAYNPLQVRDASEWDPAPEASVFRRQIDGTAGNGGAGVDLLANIGSTQGCPTTRRVALVGIAADCNYRADFSTEQAAKDNIIQQVNAASQVYESTFNISLAIRNLTVVGESCPTVATPAVPWNLGCNAATITDRLNLFSAWRGLSKDGNAYWTLLTKCATGSAVGLAWLGQVCVQDAFSGAEGSNETIASANVVVRTSTEWQVFAHESGHTFGAVHDCVASTCQAGDNNVQRCCPFSRTTCDANGGFIMNPSTGNGITAFSPCSIGNICSALGRFAVRSDCLTNNKDVTTFTGSQCGNGIVETGEDCDCGGEQGCGQNPCCDAATCKFKANAVCDPSNEDCCSPQCQFASAGTVCRPSTGSCDPQETCTGDQPMCPPDSHKNDGDSCGSGLTCASGQCTSRDQQCKTMMASSSGGGNDTYACGSTGCSLTCASPRFGPGQCVRMNQNFLDGTPCEGGGKCANGICQGSNVGAEIGDFIVRNKHIFIPVISVVGGLLLIAVISCIVGAIRKRRARGRGVPIPPKGPAPMHGPQGQQQWDAYNGSYGPGSQPPPGQAGMFPSQPPPAAQGPPPNYIPYQDYHQQRQQAQQQWGQRSRSMRYA